MNDPIKALYLKYVAGWEVEFRQRYGNLGAIQTIAGVNPIVHGKPHYLVSPRTHALIQAIEALGKEHK